MKELLIMAKSLGGGGSEVALIELINALPEEVYNITLVLLDSDNEYAYRLKKKVNIVQLTFNSSFAKSLVSMETRSFTIRKFLRRNLNVRVITASGQTRKPMSGFRLLRMALLRPAAGRAGKAVGSYTAFPAGRQRMGKG